MTQPHLSKDPLSGLFKRGTAKQGTDLQLRIGHVEVWFSAGANNTITIDGVEIRNMPILFPAVDHTQIERGMDVAILVSRDARGVATYLIIGRARIPDGSEW